MLMVVLFFQVFSFNTFADTPTPQQQAAGLIYLLARASQRPDAALNISNPMDYADFEDLVSVWRDTSMTSIMNHIQQTLMHERSDEALTRTLQTQLTTFVQTQNSAIADLSRGLRYMIAARFREECRTRCQVDVIGEDADHLRIRVSSDATGMNIVIASPRLPLLTIAESDLVKQRTLDPFRAAFQSATRQFTMYRKAISKAQVLRQNDLTTVLSRVFSNPSDSREEIVTLQGFDIHTT
jgi:hypothetical protein